MKKDLVVLVTGANAGMGKSCSLALAKEGASVVMLCRSPERGQTALEDVRRESGSDNLELAICDLSSLECIERFCKEFTDTHPRLDALINNAGVLKARRLKTKDGFELHFGVNHLGHFLLTNRLLPLIIRSAPSRIVVVSSFAHRAGRIRFDDVNLEKHFTFWRGYPQSKLANVLFTYELAERLSGTGVAVNCLDPGIVGTDIVVNRETGVGTYLSRLQKLLFMPPEKGAETAVYLASSPDAEGVTGKFFKLKKEVPSCRRSYDREAAKRLWDISERMAGLKPEEFTEETAAEDVGTDGEPFAHSL
jgi:NAD(P)-dependent dehydrogenase (short-subunit alcohol dehydrogenase family)